jgi:hypothetical protein
MKHWTDLWNRYWFPTTATRTLALCRVIAVAAQLVWFVPNTLERHINLVLKNSAFVDPQILIRGIDAVLPRDVVFTPQSITALYWITVAAGITAVVGLFARTSLFIFALGTWFFISHKYSYADIHHPEAVFAIFLMSLALAPSGHSLSFDALIRRYRARRAGKSAELLESSDLAIWPLKLAHVLLALTYFSTGASKLLAGGLGWMNGYTVQMYTFGGAVQRDRPWGIWLAQFHTLGALLGAMTLFFELFFFVSLLVPRTAPFFFLSGILFHVGLYLFMGHPFFSHILLNAILLVFLYPDRLPHLVSSYKVRFPSGKRAQAYEA